LYQEVFSEISSLVKYGWRNALLDEMPFPTVSFDELQVWLNVFVEM